MNSIALHVILRVHSNCMAKCVYIEYQNLYTFCKMYTHFVFYIVVSSYWLITVVVIADCIYKPGIEINNKTARDSFPAATKNTAMCYFFSSYFFSLSLSHTHTHKIVLFV